MPMFLVCKRMSVLLEPNIIRLFHCLQVSEATLYLAIAHKVAAGYCMYVTTINSVFCLIDTDAVEGFPTVS